MNLRTAHDTWTTLQLVSSERTEVTTGQEPSAQTLYSKTGSRKELTEQAMTMISNQDLEAPLVTDQTNTTHPANQGRAVKEVLVPDRPVTLCHRQENTENEIKKKMKKIRKARKN